MISSTNGAEIIGYSNAKKSHRIETLIPYTKLAQNGS
jgi:hypothetical protein